MQSACAPLGNTWRVVCLMQIHEKALDTKALMAWNEDTVVLSFRGTASFKNVLAGALIARPPIVPGSGLLGEADGYDTRTPGGGGHVLR